MDEIWKNVPGFGDHYEASSLGRIRSKARVVVRRGPRGGTNQVFNYQSRILSPLAKTRDGHLNVHICVDNVRHIVGVHRLVLMAFVGLPQQGQECCHNDGNAANNRPENLRWDSHANNNRDRKLHGRYAIGERHPMSKFSNALIAQIREEGIGYAEAASRYGISKTHAHRLFAKSSARAISTDQ